MWVFLLSGLVVCIVLIGCSSIFDKYVEYCYVEFDNYLVLKVIGYVLISV